MRVRCQAGVADLPSLRTTRGGRLSRVTSGFARLMNGRVLVTHDGGAKVVPGARIHPVRAPKGDGHWISTNPNQTTRDN